ncbi:hypothetical protein S58_27590 [Bradyrhizobium oligotrophicum S58]|uniref:Uncharacterized protein n=1 Tax=Bradyrhizobium oligotrophicum S58 TaxID=1245469 RepID=M4ZRB2_9BRAD|nr:hypothetical protein [Bradyrhizobium oligotrophicum]BAM88765.1 hypothetical protein S58_27590 [Bradyrhizobium oligotrophicum S58]
MARYIWFFGVVVFGGLELYLLTQARRNLAPGVERKDVIFLRRFAAQVDKELFNGEGQKYRAWAIKNETAFSFWIFAIGPLVALFG